MAVARSLQIELGVVDAASSHIQGVDSAVDDVRDNLEGTQSDMSDLSYETGEFAYSAQSDMQEVGGSIDDLGHKTSTFRDTMGRAGSYIQRNWNMIAGAIGAAGGAMEIFARQQQELIESSDRLAYSTDLQAEEVRDLALESHDATFALQDIYDAMEIGRMQGIEAGEQLQEFAEFWDMVGDASGEGSTELAKAGVALRSVGIEAGEEQEALDAFGFITQETTGTISDFLYFLERTGPELREMGMGVDEAAAISGALERELGMTARTARQEFRQAVNEAEGDTDVLLDTLGLTESQLEDYQGRVQESSGAIEDLAQIHYDNITAAQHLQAWVEGLTHQYGSHFMPIIEILSPLMMGAAVTMGTLAAAQYVTGISAGVAAKAVWGLTAAFLASPLGWIVAGVAAVIGVLMLLGVEFEDVANFARNAWSTITDVIGRAIDWISSINLHDIGRNILDSLVEGVLSRVEWLREAITGVGETITGGITSFFGISSPSQLMVEYGINMGEGLQLGLEEESENFFRRAQRMFSPEREREQVAVAGGARISVGDIHVYSQSDDPREVAREVKRTLRREFPAEAERYFSRQRRKR